MNKVKEKESMNKLQTLLINMPNFYDNRSQESAKAKKLLKKYNIPMFAFITDNVIRPELQVDRWVYRGIDEIKNYINNKEA